MIESLKICKHPKKEIYRTERHVFLRCMAKRKPGESVPVFMVKWE